MPVPADFAVRNIGQMATPQGVLPLKGAELRRLHTVLGAAIACYRGKIVFAGRDKELSREVSLSGAKVLDARGRCAVPGFADPHTHLVFAGNRAHEFAQKLDGASYEDIARRGGGILFTVEATRRAPEKELYALARRRMDSALRHGTTALEVKSGYGLALEPELKILRVVRRLSQEGPQDVAATFLGAHTLPKEFRMPGRRGAYIRMLTEEWLPRVAAEGLADCCDVFCERGAFTLAESRRILEKARALGMKLRIHAEQLSHQGGCALGARMDAASVDHADHASEADIRLLARTRTPTVLLPGVPHFLRLKRWPPARKMIAAGVPVALATDFNPGSCHTENMQEIMALACLRMDMRVEEALCAATLNAAAALGWEKRMGSLERGKQADFLLMDVPDYRHLVYHFGVNQVAAVVKKGRLAAGTL